jgi:Neutral/alkaline non-lysosomal ceramidase, N-terminal
MSNTHQKSAPDATPPPGFRGIIGAGRRDITPPPGINARNWGAATFDVAQGIHRPLLATALTLQAAADQPPLVLVALDLGWWRDRDDEAIVRRGILAAIGLPEERLIMALSHTHAGPCTSLLNADLPGGQLIRPYLEALRDACVQAIEEALAQATQAQLIWGMGHCALASNRDLPDTHRPRFLTGYNPDAVADDTLLVGRITAGDGRTLATLVNYACHPTTLAWQNTLISPDYVGAMREVIEAHTDGARCLFLQGASGELAPREQYTGDVAVADRHGRALGWACMATLETMPSPGMRLGFDSVVESGAPLAVWREAPWRAPNELAAAQSHVALLLKPDLQSLAEIEAQLARTNDPVLVERLRRRWGVRRIVGDGDAWVMPIYAWRIGDALLVAQPNEAYSWFQQELRRRFAPRALAVLNLSNGSCGYLPPAALYAEDIYTVWQSPFAVGGLEALVERAAAVLATL